MGAIIVREHLIAKDGICNLQKTAVKKIYNKKLNHIWNFESMKVIKKNEINVFFFFFAKPNSHWYLILGKPNLLAFPDQI